MRRILSVDPVLIIIILVDELDDEFNSISSIFRTQEEETERQQFALERTLRNLKSELRSEVKDATEDIENSRPHADETLKELYKEQEANERKLHTLREVHLI